MTLKEFPNSQQEPFEMTSPETDQYNCLAWAMQDTDRWWDTEDEGFWIALPRDSRLETLINLCEKLDFEICQNGDLEQGFEKITLFSLDQMYCTHVARQLPNGQWTSKLGTSYDVTHSLMAMENGIYGNVTHFLKKQLNTDN